jgi:hypothetical protein
MVKQSGVRWRRSERSRESSRFGINQRRPQPRFPSLLLYSYFDNNGELELGRIGQEHARTRPTPSREDAPFIVLGLALPHSLPLSQTPPCRPRLQSRERYSLLVESASSLRQSPFDPNFRFGHHFDHDESPRDPQRTLHSLPGWEVEPTLLWRKQFRGDLLARSRRRFIR